jgi:hypothetical protein
MKRFAISLLMAVSLIFIWLLIYITGGYPGQGQVYFQDAPWWHIVLHAVWVISSGVTGLYGIIY